MSEKMTTKPTAFYANNAQYILTSYYGWRDIGRNGPEFHNGIDFVSKGDKAVISIFDGKVIDVRNNVNGFDTSRPRGNYVQVESSYNDKLYRIYYQHLATVDVTKNQIIHAGDLLGLEGSTGWSTGSHLHFEVRDINNKPVDPTTIIGINIAYQANILVTPGQEIEYEYRKGGYGSASNIDDSSINDSYYQDTDGSGIIVDNTDGYEPIYPDLTMPPILLTTKLYENSVNIKDIDILSNAKKENTGGIINYDDPYPIDKKIAQLENHVPAIEGDIAVFPKCSALDCNCPESIRKLVSRINELSKSVEKRMVQIENISAANFRMLHRLSSRINVNCVYYGGQSVFDKYLCIRCLHDDMVNDTAISLDQCLNCTRYEPIIGQVYELDDE